MYFVSTFVALTKFHQLKTRNRIFLKSQKEIHEVRINLLDLIDVQYRQSESDGQIHQTSFTMDPMEFFF